MKVVATLKMFLENLNSLFNFSLQNRYNSLDKVNMGHKNLPSILVLDIYTVWKYCPNLDMYKAKKHFYQPSIKIHQWNIRGKSPSLEIFCNYKFMSHDFSKKFWQISVSFSTILFLFHSIQLFFPWIHQRKKTT